MADDIVERLANACAHPCDLCGRENAYVVGEDAADEIERWRSVGMVLDGYFDTECRFDHHGFCQAHLMEDDGCSVAAMRALLGDDRG